MKKTGREIGNSPSNVEAVALAGKQVVEPWKQQMHS
jgi:hypothetical protein